MTFVLNYLLTAILNYGYPVIILSILLSAMAIPLPTSTLLVAAGSFSINSGLNFYLLILVATITSITGDVFGYMIGKKYGHKFKLKEIKINMPIIFLSRWLLLPIGVPINLLSGINNFKFPKFVAMVTVGEFLWSTIYVYIGYLFGNNWTSLVTYINNIPLIIAFLGIGILILIYSFSKRS